MQWHQEHYALRISISDSRLIVLPVAQCNALYCIVLHCIILAIMGRDKTIGVLTARPFLWSDECRAKSEESALIADVWFDTLRFLIGNFEMLRLFRSEYLQSWNLDYYLDIHWITCGI